MNFTTDYSSYYNIILWKRNGLVRSYKMCFLSLEFLNEEFDYIMFLKFDFWHGIAKINIKDILKSLENIYNQDQNTFIIITLRKEPPLYNMRGDEYIYSFSCSFHNFRKMVSDYTKTEFLNKNLLFEILDQIFNDPLDFSKILVRQLPFANLNENLTTNYCDVIIPHRGDNAFLKNVLHFLNYLDKVKIYIGIDQEVSDEIVDFGNKYTESVFLDFSPNPLGPYILRNYLISQSNNEIIFFQDSDDIPCADRFEKISNYMIKNGVQLCGSHELRLDYYDRTVRAYRLPLDAKAALKDGPWHSLYHPSSAITRTAFYLCEKLSEERTFGNDTKFLLSSYYKLDMIRNIDEFLYISRRHPDSLTTSPETMGGSQIRNNLSHTWNHDFELIKYGSLLLENSSLKYEKPKFKFEVKKI